MRQITYLQALNEALREELIRDERVFIAGEDVAVFGGGLGVTQGLYQEFGEKRVMDTPISEAAIIGLGVGAAATGLRPCVEIQFMDFIGCCMEQILNQMAKLRYMFGGKITLPLVVRTPAGAGLNAGAQHSQSLESFFTHIPGIKVVMPSMPYDAKGLLKASIRDENPVMFIEPKLLMAFEGPVPEEEYTLPLGEADIKREGKDVSIVSWSYMVHVALRAAEAMAKEGIEAEIVDLRTLKPLDEKTLLGSVEKTGKVIILHEAWRTTGFGAEVAAVIAEKAFDYLDAPITRVTAPDTPAPFSPVLESFFMPDEENVIQAVKGIL
ncbi:MAG: alpha-ketoacid dehydrogenase subunit beta [Deltaproteobacteria bacterium]|nr:MAG: alpha-ketoacid dehydrogenase subunit beta [Deltaproteobacteria bacterium]